MPTLTDDQLDNQVRDILHFHRGRAAANRSNNNVYDRRIRASIARWRDTDLIVDTDLIDPSSSIGGYWLAEDMKEIELIAAEYVSRAREMGRTGAQPAQARGRDVRSADCAVRGLPMKKPHQVRAERVELIEMVGKVEPPALQDTGEQSALVRRILCIGGPTAFEDAVSALRDYMHEKDSPVPLVWCRGFVTAVKMEMMEAEKC